MHNSMKSKQAATVVLQFYASSPANQSIIQNHGLAACTCTSLQGLSARLSSARLGSFPSLRFGMDGVGMGIGDEMVCDKRAEFQSWGWGWDGVRVR